MADLAANQARFIDVLQKGPSAYPDGLFAGASARVLLGLKVHANTISHARLVALEQTFPRTLQRLGADRFNALSRQFIEQAQTRPCKPMEIGRDFGAFLQCQNCDAASVDLARIEWAWLESYHAADARALVLADLAGLDEEGLLDLPLVIHPAVRTVKVTGALAEELTELADTFASDDKAVLITRPDADVRLHALDPDRAAILAAMQNSDRMRNLLAMAIEAQGEAEALPRIFALIEAGVLASPNI